jgi:hypothetical protein
MREMKNFRHKIFQMEKVIPFFKYESIVMTPKSKTSYEEKEKSIDVIGPLETRTT